MARRMRISAAAAALMAVSADASAFTWQQRRNAWYPPTETLVARDIMAELGWRSPEPTPAPVPREAIPEIVKRQTDTENTCGYISGIKESSLYCDAASMCVYNSIQSIVGCCPDTNTQCDLVTTCLGAADGSSVIASGSTIGTETMWCDYTDYPSCLTHLYADSLFTGYSVFGCGVLGGTDTISYTADSDASTTGRGSGSTSVDDNIATATSTASDPDQTGNGGSGSSSSSSSSSSGGKKKKSNTGAIVGAVVGGVAALAVLAIAGFFMAKKKKQANETKMASPPMANIPPGAAPVTTFPPQSPMAVNNMNNMGAPPAMYPPPGPGSPPLQQQGAHIPSAYSMGSPSPGTDYTSSGYPSGISSTHQMMSPPLPPQSVSPQPQQMYAQPPYGQQQSPPPPQQGYGAGWAAPPQQPPPPQQQQQQQQGFVAELSTDKGHSEVRELPG